MSNVHYLVHSLIELGLQTNPYGLDTNEQSPLLSSFPDRARLTKKPMWFRNKGAKSIIELSFQKNLLDLETKKRLK